jgi:hypothetical protein
MDMGILYRPVQRISLGFSLANFNKPDVGLAEKQTVPMVLRTGVTYKHRLLKGTVAMTRRHYLDSVADHRILMGVERSWILSRFGEVSVRGGAGFGNRDFRQVTMGGGYDVSGFGVDYSFHIPLGGLDETGGTHRLSLTYKFGKAPPDEELEYLIRREIEAAERARAALKIAEDAAKQAKVERDRIMREMEILKRQLEEESIKSPGSRPAAEKVKEILFERTKASELAARERVARERAQQEFSNAYRDAMRAYNKRVERGATLTSRVRLLQEIMKKYEGTGLELLDANRELERVEGELAQARADYKLSWSFYRRIVGRGAEENERISLLERMRKKYLPTGINISELEKELKVLKKE